jgi:hypothetical protein
MNTPRTKSDIRASIAKGELREALAAALHYAEYCGSAAAINQLNALSARLESDIAHWRSGQMAYEDFSRMQSQCAHALLAGLEELPNQPQPNAAPRKLLKEDRLQKHLLLLLLLSKGFLLLWVWRQWQMGSFNAERAMTVYAVLTPTFVASLFVMVEHYVRAQTRQEALIQRVVSGPLVWIAYAMFPIYACFAWHTLCMGTLRQEWSFATMSTVLSGLETVFGGLTAKVIGAFFRSARE